MKEPKEENTEQGEVTVTSPHSIIYDGDWKVRIHTNKLTKGGLGMRRYHHHGDHWYTVRNNDRGWVCNKCNEPTPDAMEGYINLARWSINVD